MDIKDFNERIGLINNYILESRVLVKSDIPKLIAEIKDLLKIGQMVGMI